MKKLLLLVVSAGLLAYTLVPQWRSFERMGEQRFQALSRPRKEILVGVYWPFTANQDGMANGLQLALDEINTGGLARGIPFRLILREGFSWEEAKQIAVEFSANRNMSAVLGYYDSAEAIKASMIYESSRLLHIIVGANSTTMTGRGLKYIVRTIPSGYKIARSLAKFSVEDGRRKFALIWQEDAYGEDLAFQYRIGLDALDTQLVYQWSYSREHVDFRLPVNELKGIGADMIFIAGLEPWAGDFLRMARAVGIKTKIMGAFSDTPEMRARAGAGLEDVIYFDFYDVNSPSPENQMFVRKFRARYGRNPDTWAAQGYDALRILAKAVQTTGSANPLDLSYAIRFMDPWEGANGKYKFDSRGELEDKPIFLKAYRNGTPVTIQEVLQAPAPPIG
ncbi:MAG TPA: ABC transporter substrate-binding protein [Bryobacteraceae bacterium]|nr:ABC transporter substrate-binding protein [Bryobacteraceae bacterium]